MGFQTQSCLYRSPAQLQHEREDVVVSRGSLAVFCPEGGAAAAQGLTTQPQIFAGAIANFLSVIGLPHSLVFTLINLAVSAFALTSLDSVARVGRLSFQEFFLDSDTDEENMSPFLKVVTNKYFATIIYTIIIIFSCSFYITLYKQFFRCSMSHS